MAPKVTKGLVKLAHEVANELCDRDGKALSKAFGNFDRRVALGWLLADAAFVRSRVPSTAARSTRRSVGEQSSTRRSAADSS